MRDARTDLQHRHANFHHAAQQYEFRGREYAELCEQMVSEVRRLEAKTEVHFKAEQALQH